MVGVFSFVCCLTAMAILQSHTWTFEVSTSCCCFVLFVLVFEKIASQKLTLPEPYLVHLATVLGRLCYEGFFLFLFLTTIDRCFKDGYCGVGIVTDWMLLFFSHKFRLKMAETSYIRSWRQASVRTRCVKFQSKD